MIISHVNIRLGLFVSMHYAEERFMDLIEVNMKQEQKQHVHAWENITLVEEEADLANKLLPSLHF
jgi:hypothetical protein